MVTTIRPPFRYIGGKQSLATWIVNLMKKTFPDEQLLVSPFIGGGSVELRWMSATKGHCHAADIEEPLANCWQWLLQEPKSLADHAKELMPVTRERWQRWYQEWQVPHYPPTLENAAKYALMAETKAIKGWSFSPGITREFQIGRRDKRTKGGFMGAKQKSCIARLAHWQRFRAPRLSVACADFEKHLREHPTGIIYADPPYFGTESLYQRRDHEGKRVFQLTDHNRLADMLLDRGGFALSYGDHPWVRERYQQDGVVFHERPVRYANKPRGEDRALPEQNVELLIVKRRS